jgi:hypothetical protein
MGNEKNRINKLLTVSITPAATEAVELLQKYYNNSNKSHVVDTVIREHIKALGYQEIQMGLEMESVSVEIISEGNHLIKHAKNGENYFEAPESGEYIIRVSNKTWGRKEIVVSVDGLSVMDGEEASFETRGYIIPSYSHIDIRGWRRTDNDVASFTFDRKESSYSAQIGKGTNNVGVIGVAVFNEKRAYSYWDLQYDNCVIKNDGLIFREMSQPISTKEYLGHSMGVEVTCSNKSSDSFTRSSVNNKESTRGIDDTNYDDEVDSLSITQYNIGTGYGKEAAMKVTRISFERASSTPDFVTSYRYASRPTLIKWGVITEKPAQPNPFPGNKIACKAPLGWKG